jgi:hypothetical protein
MYCFSVITNYYKPQYQKKKKKKKQATRNQLHNKQMSTPPEFTNPVLIDLTDGTDLWCSVTCGWWFYVLDMLLLLSVVALLLQIATRKASTLPTDDF